MSFQLNYTFSSDKNVLLEYNYNITANLIGTVENIDNQDKEVWNKSFMLLDNKYDEVYGNQFYINEQINIDYEYYNNLARSYEKTYGIVINSVLKLYLNVSYNINFQKDNLEVVNDFIELDIPITNTVTEVKENYENLSNSIYPEVQNTNIVKTIYILLGIILVISSIILIIVKIKNKLKMPLDLYTKNINNIFKYYNDLIVTVKNKPDIGNLKIMKLSFFEDLVDVAEQNNSNIIYYEVLENERGNFYVIINDYVYIYVVTRNKLR